jgi:serpin B
MRLMLATLVVAGLLLVGCGSSGAPAAADTGQSVASTQQRNQSPNVPPADLAALVAGNTRFALDLYQRQSAEGNLFCSPYSISLALAMAYAGARGATATQMASTLGFTLPPERLHPACNALDLALLSRATTRAGEQAFRFRLANALWGQRGETFQAPFLDALALNYGAGMRVVDYRADAETARRAINVWVAEQTAERVKDLLPQGAVNDLTRLVLTNAIYFLAPWATPFEPGATTNGTFTCLDGARVTAPFLHGVRELPYAVGDVWEAVELPYVGGQVALLAIVPGPGRFAAVSAALDATKLGAIVGALQPAQVTLALPKFSFSSSLGLVATLRALGTTDAFDPARADLSGINGRRDLYVTDVVHKAFVKLDEQGTEAAAATGVVFGTTSIPALQAILTIDRPFLIVLRDRPTGTILFLGRVANPTA